MKRTPSAKVVKVTQKKKPVTEYTPKADKGGTTKATDINQMSSDEIREHLAAVRLAQMSLLAKNAQKGATIKNPMQIRQNRRTIARMLTVLVKRGERAV